MQVKRVELTNFRSYKKQEFAFDPAGNLIIGQNGSGKTNLFEAVAYTGLGKSIRFHSDDELLQHGADGFAIEADYFYDTGLNLGVKLRYQDHSKQIHLDNEVVRRLSRLFETIKVIYYAPEDLQLINGSPRQRRQYFDQAISQIYPDYLNTLRNYQHIVDQRNSLLKTSYSPSVKRSWDTRFSSAVISVLDYRKKYLYALNASFTRDYQTVSAKTKDLRINYQSSLKQDADRELDADAVMAQLQKLESRENLVQRSLAGAHLDDYEFELNGLPLRVYGSQGQKRISVIILKLIQASMIETITSLKPILLFDDIFAELDLRHTHKIKELISDSYQVFISSPKEDLVKIWQELRPIRLGEAL